MGGWDKIWERVSVGAGGYYERMKVEIKVMLEGNVEMEVRMEVGRSYRISLLYISSLTNAAVETLPAAPPLGGGGGRTRIRHSPAASPGSFLYKYEYKRRRRLASAATCSKGYCWLWNCGSLLLLRSAALFFFLLFLLLDLTENE